MNIAIIGYGKMGQAIEKIAQDRKHNIVYRIENTSELESVEKEDIDVAIEFSQPDVAFSNIITSLKKGIPTISGTTGWLDRYQEVVDLCNSRKGTFLYASNFSIGVNLFFELNDWLSKKIINHNFDVEIEEIHHTQKKDSPSGTALKLAEDIIENDANISSWINEKSTDHNTLGIISKRIANIPGTHTVSYKSPLESINIEHIAHDRNVFAQGAVLVAEWILKKQGVLSMSDFINDTLK